MKTSRSMTEYILSRAQMQAMIPPPPTPYGVAGVAPERQSSKEDYPLQIWVVVIGDTSRVFPTKEEAFKFANARQRDTIVGTYTLSGLKKLEHQIVEVDV